jgi:hypothetical protein
MEKRLCRQFFKAALSSTIYVTDSETQPEGRCVSEKLGKIVGKGQPQP